MKVEDKINNASFVNYGSIRKMLNGIFSNEEIENLIITIDENSELNGSDLTLNKKIKSYIILNGNTRVNWRSRLDNLGITDIRKTGYLKSFFKSFTKNPATHFVPLFGVFSLYNPGQPAFSKEVYRIDFTDWSYSKHKVTNDLVRLKYIKEPDKWLAKVGFWFKKRRNSLFTYECFFLSNDTKDKFLPKTCLPLNEINFDTKNYKFFLLDDICNAISQLHTNWDGQLKPLTSNLTIQKGANKGQKIQNNVDEPTINTITYRKKTLENIIYALYDSVNDLRAHFSHNKEISPDLLKVTSKTALAKYLYSVHPELKGLSDESVKGIFSASESLKNIDHSDLKYIHLVLIIALKNLTLGMLTSKPEKRSTKYDHIMRSDNLLTLSEHLCKKEIIGMTGLAVDVDIKQINTLLTDSINQA